VVLKARIGRIIPQSVLNYVLLQFPFLYRTGFVNYESYLADGGGIDDLLGQLEMVSTLDGNIIECGSARCGTSVLIAKFLQSNRIQKRIYSLDLFGKGLDANELDEERKECLTKVSDKAFTYNSYEYVLRKVRKLGFDNTIIPVKGFFRDTLPSVNSKFCLSFIDCDLSKSIEYCAEKVWPETVSGGVMLFDDYRFQNYKGVKPTVDAFVSKYKGEIEQHGLLTRLYYVRKKN
jgi:Macrocin-O-methyltransferase (TylF)